MYYAEDDFGHVWAGPYNTFVPWNSFDWCWNTASTSGKTVGMRIFCLDWDIMDHTKILTLQAHYRRRNHVSVPALIRSRADESS